MSQYGALGYAKHGRDFRSILTHFYTGTRLSRLWSSPDVRVLLQTGATSFTGASWASGRRLSSQALYRVSAAGLGYVSLSSADGTLLQTFPSPVLVSGSDPVQLRGKAQNGLEAGRYRGVLEFQSTLNGLRTVNDVSLEDYVRGALGAEMPPSWPANALRSQAVASRTYAVTTSIGPDFDQFADSRSQIYKGVAAETAATDAAAAATAGQVVTYLGEPVVTYYFESSGGRTENIENAFLGAAPKPWLVSVADPYDAASPRHRWGPYSYPMAQVEAKLHGLLKGKFRSIQVLERGRSPRVVRADILGSKGRTQVTGAQLRAAFGLFDTWATFAVRSIR